MVQEKWSGRTDLALEERERYPKGGEIPGVAFYEEFCSDDDIKITTVEILDGQGVQYMRKPEGTYITIESRLLSGEKEEREKCITVLRECLERLLPARVKKILAVGLGNRNMTADALGPKTVELLEITGHIQDETPRIRLYGLSPGVMGQTGMETFDILSGVISRLRPDAMLVVDALAARSPSRLCTTVQMSDTGISPGSGVGNHRKGLNRETMGVPVIAVGIPTVISIEAIVSEAIAGADHNAGELLPEEYRNLFVMMRDMDERVETQSRLLAEAVNRYCIKQ